MLISIGGEVKKKKFFLNLSQMFILVLVASSRGLVLSVELLRLGTMSLLVVVGKRMAHLMGEFERLGMVPVEMMDQCLVAGSFLSRLELLDSFHQRSGQLGSFHRHLGLMADSYLVLLGLKLRMMVLGFVDFLRLDMDRLYRNR